MARKLELLSCLHVTSARLPHNHAMRVTREFIMAHRTERGSWTYAQIEALGLECPPRKGWMNLVIGRELTDAQARQFMDSNIPRKVKTREQPSLF